MERAISIMQLFFPYAYRRQTTVQTKGMRFVHYTSADAAANILRTKEVWMRKSSCMNDYMEVEHGLACLSSAYKGERGKRFQQVLNNIFDGISEQIAALFDGWQDHLRDETYLMCLSEHDDTEDGFGRLSMWRAYSEGTGVALVLNNAPFLAPSDALKAYTSPVAYLDDKAFGDELGKIADGIEANSDIVRALGRDAVTTYIFHAFKFAALCTKHPGFKEEREWRVVYSPTLDKSSHLIKGIQVIRGTPQPIYKIPLRNIPDEGFVGAEIPELLDRIIIGPSDYPTAMREAFRDLLAEAGVTILQTSSACQAYP